jgi:hypothetical protein
LARASWQDGTVDISPKSRLFLKERDIVAALYAGARGTITRAR